MPVILHTQHLKFNQAKKQPVKIFVQGKEFNQQMFLGKNYQKNPQGNKIQLLHYNNIKAQTGKSILSQNEKLVSLSKSKQKIQKKSRETSKKLFQNAKKISDPNIETYLSSNIQRNTSRSIRKVQSSRQLLTIHKERNEKTSNFIQIPKNIKHQTNKAKILSKVSQEQVSFQDGNSFNFQQNLVKPLKDLMIDTIQERKSAKIHQLTESDHKFLSALKENIKIKPTDQIDYIQQDIKQIRTNSQNKNNMLSSLSRLILQENINDTNSFEVSKQLFLE